MTKLASVIAGVLLVACTSEVEAPSAPTNCNKTDRSGTYLFTFTVQSGTCPAIPSTLISFDSTNTSTACTKHSEVWSEADCKLATDQTCVATQTDGTTSTTKAVMVSRQQTQNGSKLDGLYSVDIALSSGARCVGTYAITAVRQ